jgi:hypothetical protein
MHGMRFSALESHAFKALAVLGVTALAWALLGAPTNAGAQSVADGTLCFDDPVGETNNADNDISRVCVSYVHGEITFRIDIVGDTNTGNAPLVHFDTSGNGEADYILARNDVPRSVITDPGGRELCEVRSDRGGGGARIYRDIDSSCVGQPDSFSVYVQTHDNFGEVADRAPDAGWSQLVGPASNPTPRPPSERTADRLAGPDRFATAVSISKHQFPHGATEVYLARADASPDALGGGALTRGPVLLVPACGQVPGVVLDELARLQPMRVFALGGGSAICDQVLTDARNA